MKKMKKKVKKMLFFLKKLWLVYQKRWYRDNYINNFINPDILPQQQAFPVKIGCPDKKEQKEYYLYREKDIGKQTETGRE